MSDLTDEELTRQYEAARKKLETLKKSRAPGPEIDAARKEWMSLQYQMKTRKLHVGKWLSMSLVGKTSRRVRYLRGKYGPGKAAKAPEPGTQLTHSSGRQVTFSGMVGNTCKLSDGRRMSLGKMSRDYSWSGKSVECARGRGLRGWHSLLPPTTRNPLRETQHEPPTKYQTPTLVMITSLRVGESRRFGQEPNGRPVSVYRVSDTEWSTNYASTRNSNRLTAQQALADVMSRVDKELMMGLGPQRTTLALVKPGQYFQMGTSGAVYKMLPDGEYMDLQSRTIKKVALAGRPPVEIMDKQEVRDMGLKLSSFNPQTPEEKQQRLTFLRRQMQALAKKGDKSSQTYKNYLAEYQKLSKTRTGGLSMSNVEEESGKCNCDFPSEQQAQAFAAEAMKVPGAKVTCSGKSVSCTYPHAAGASIMASAGKYYATQSPTSPGDISRKARYEALKVKMAMGTVSASNGASVSNTIRTIEFVLRDELQKLKSVKSEKAYAKSLEVSVRLLQQAIGALNDASHDALKSSK